MLRVNINPRKFFLAVSFPVFLVWASLTLFMFLLVAWSYEHHNWYSLAFPCLQQQPPSWNSLFSDLNKSVSSDKAMELFILIWHLSQCHNLFSTDRNWEQEQWSSYSRATSMTQKWILGEGGSPPSSQIALLDFLAWKLCSMSKLGEGQSGFQCSQSAVSGVEFHLLHEGVGWVTEASVLLQYSIKI